MGEGIPEDTAVAASVREGEREDVRSAELLRGSVIRDGSGVVDDEVESTSAVAEGDTVEMSAVESGSDVWFAAALGSALTASGTGPVVDSAAAVASAVGLEDQK